MFSFPFCILQKKIAKCAICVGRNTRGVVYLKTSRTDPIVTAESSNDRIPVAIAARYLREQEERKRGREGRERERTKKGEGERDQGRKEEKNERRKRGEGRNSRNCSNNAK